MRAAISGTIGKQADRRLLDALAAPDVNPSDFSVDSTGRPREELWFDYVSDLGDGWDSTYAVAQLVARPKLTVRDETGASYDTRGGELLVFGGDEVYPTASVKAYEERTLHPWTCAIQGQRPPPHVFAVPGNHDWYDGLVSFMRLFCQGRTLSGFETHQRRSYFAVKLPHGWWLIGTDMQLESDLDQPQVDYFQEVARRMKEEDRVILCLAEPAWLVSQVRPPRGPHLSGQQPQLPGGAGAREEGQRLPRGGSAPLPAARQRGGPAEDHRGWRRRLPAPHAHPSQGGTAGGWLHRAQELPHGPGVTAAELAQPGARGEQPAVRRPHGRALHAADVGAGGEPGRGERAAGAGARGAHGALQPGSGAHLRCSPSWG